MGDKNKYNLEEFDDMTNDNIAKRLREEFKFDCGPVTESTRRVYLNKLKKLIKEKDERNGESESSSSVVNKTECLEVETSKKSQQRSSKARQSSGYKKQRKSPSPRVELNVYDNDNVNVNDNDNDNDDEDDNRGVSSQNQNEARFKMPKSAPRRQSGLSSTYGTHGSGSKSSSTSTSSTSTSTTKTHGRKSQAVTNSALPKSLISYSSESSENDDNDKEEMKREVRRSPRRRNTPSRPSGVSTRFVDMSPNKICSTRPSSPYQNANEQANLNRLSMPLISPLARPPIHRRQTGGYKPVLEGFSETQGTGGYKRVLGNFSDSDETEAEQQQDTVGDQDDDIRQRLLKHRVGKSPQSTQSSTHTPDLTTQPDLSSHTPATQSNFPLTDENNTTSNWVSFAILTFVLLFFVFIMSFYFYQINLNKDSIDFSDIDFIKDQNSIHAPICQPTFEEHSTPHEDVICFQQQTDVSRALKIIKQIKNHIDHVRYKHFCANDVKYSEIDPHEFDIEQVKTVVQENVKNIHYLNDNFKSIFDNALQLIHLNPTWPVRLTKDSIEEFKNIQLSDDYPINFPLICKLSLLIKNLAWKITSVVVALVLCWLGYIYYRYRKRVVNEEQELVYDYVDKSLDLLQSPDNPQSMPVLHIRDTLFSPSERKTSKYKRIWQRVVKFIETHESRVKVETENIDGEDFKSWKWVASNTTLGVEDKSSNILKTGSIEWQGQAFGENSPAANNGKVQASNFIAPTEYLKIRNMYTRENQLSNPDQWKSNIKNALLQKIITYHGNDSHGIVHLDFDNSNDGIVYLKCDSIKSATNAYHALHGWWCQGELVSVKFLKQERYYSRFPEAVKSSTYLKVEEN